MKDTAVGWGIYLIGLLSIFAIDYSMRLVHEDMLFGGIPDNIQRKLAATLAVPALWFIFKGTKVLKFKGTKASKICFRLISVAIQGYVGFWAAIMLFTGYALFLYIICIPQREICLDQSGRLGDVAAEVPKDSSEWSISEGLYSGLEERDGLVFKAGATSPYTGRHSSFYDNGRQAAELYFRDGLKHGPHTMWDVDGIKEGELHYEQGELNGDHTIWYKSGRKNSERHYKDGESHGLWTLWKADGTISRQLCFQHGVLVNLDAENCLP